MTRQFDQPRRDDVRPSSRHTPSRPYRTERPFQPDGPRPRLNRDTVDRAWEKGGNHTHADYRPRQSAPRPGQFSDRSPSPYGNGRSAQREYEQRPSFAPRARAPYNEQRPANNRRPFNPGARGPQSGATYRQRNPEQPGNRRSFEDSEYRRFSSPSRPPYARSERDASYSARPGDQARFQNTRRPYEQDGAPRRYRDENDRPRSQERYQPPFRQGNRPRFEHEARTFERDDRAREQFSRGRRSGGPPARRDNTHPRWQSRPPTRYEPRRGPTSAQFEGDYERFDAAPEGEQPEDERHFTRLPDGRVLKGSRPSQRRQAHFWNEVTEESDTLLNQAPTDTSSEAPASLPLPSPTTRPERPPRPVAKPRTVRTIKTNHAQGSKGKKSLHGSKAKALQRKTSSPQAEGTRPSQRGYKWPTPGQSSAQ